jgi:actin-related protein 5
MAPSAVTHESGQPEAIRPPKVYPAKEAHFEAFLPPQPDGYKKAATAAARGSRETAIVIDNGTSNVHGLPYLFVLIDLY